MTSLATYFARYSKRILLPEAVSGERSRSHHLTMIYSLLHARQATGPPGPQFDPNESHVGLIRGIYITQLILMPPILFLRILSRKTRNAPLLADDWLMVAAVVCLQWFTTPCLFAYPIPLSLPVHIATDAPFNSSSISPNVLFSSTTNPRADHLLSAVTKWGYGLHIYTLTPDELTLFFKGVYAASIGYCILIPLTKLSVLLFYLRVFSERFYKKATWLLIGITVLYGISLVSVFANVCTPVPRFWTPTLNGTCLDFPTISYFFAALNITIDAIIFLLPIPALVSLQLPPAKKFGLVSLFVLGLLVCVLSIARIPEIKEFGDPDLTYGSVIFNILSEGEIFLTIVCANIPTIYSCIKDMVHKTSSTTDKSNSYGSKSGGKSKATIVPPHLASSDWQPLNNAQCDQSSTKGWNETNQPPVNMKSITVHSTVAVTSDKVRASDEEMGTLR
ncbi:MAG: hypothetical protein M1829_001989 [Trizodia sp. TS-e1964]|nr:MAG: hypothetical protein M1829_001989 [Trizodia sp. TS-e1964]